MTTKFFLDTNAVILLSGVNETDLGKLRKLKEEGKIEIQVTHVQIDEKASHLEPDFQKKNEKALSRVDGLVTICATKEIVFGILRFGYATFGSQEIHKIDKELRNEITLCMKKRAKVDSGNVKDALIGLSVLNNNHFITADDCLSYSWKKVIETNLENRKILEHKYIIPQIIRKRKPNGVLQAIIGLSCL